MSSRDFVLKIKGAVDPSLNKSLNKGSKELNKLSNEMRQMKKQSRALNTARENSKRLEAQFNKSTETYVRQQAEAKKLAEKIEKLKGEVNGTGKSTKAATIEFRKALTEQKRLEKSMVKSKSTTDKYGKELEEAREQVRGLAKDEKALGYMIDKNQARQEKIRKQMNRNTNLKDSGKQRMKKMVAPAIMIGAGIKLAIDDEAAFADVKKQIKIDDPVEIEKFRKELLKATKNIPLMNREIYEIAAAAGQAGIAQEDLAKFTADTAKVAVAFGVDAGKAGENLATWRTSLNMTQDEVMHLSDQVNTLGDNIKVTPAQISDIVTAMGPLGKEANFTASQTAALGGTLIALGAKDASTASTAIRKLYSTLSSGEAASGGRKDAYEILGFDPKEIAEELQRDSEGTLNKVLASFGQLDESRRMSVGTMLFGEEAVGALLPLANQLGKVNESFALVNDKAKTANSVNNEFGNVNGTAAAQLKIFTKSLLNLGLAFANYLLPPLKILTKGLNKGTQLLTAFAERFPGLTQFLTLATTGFIGINLAIGAATFGIGALGTALTIITAHPIILTLTAIAAGLYTIYKNWDRIKKFFKGGKTKTTVELEEKTTQTGKRSHYTGRGKRTTLEVDGFATGGIVASPQLAVVGEGGSPESIIPHDGSSRSKNLWFETGKSLGMFGKERVSSALERASNRNSIGNSAIKFELNAPFSPVIHGDVGNSERELINLFKDYQGDLKKLIIETLNEIKRKERRMSFG